ncbi:ExbD/TolR family protein [Chryseobacterium sp.]|uniref:ExbD/TolR family protein n=1 Tax=Chryseobacterium sp. TaxID=1871047 RepID=UPI0011CC1F72|nr:biopolymer transporter ExbD [Chryseobacterium sp.]TXF76052.1 biopolymer transporter ExbD [Chryseobacterium sp.]
MNLKRRNKANPDFSLAAMVDVILLLLIFFMVTSSAASQSAIDVKLPKGEIENPNIPNEVSVSIKQDGSYFLGDTAVKKEELESVLVNQLKNSQNASFTIRADRNSLHKDVVYVMEIAEKHKFNIAIATIQEE